MANQERYYTSLDLPRLHRNMIGFERLFNDMFTEQNRSSNYPPYNIIKHSDTSYSIEIAVAGFTDDELVIEVKDQTLYVLGEHAQVRPETDELLFQGLSNRSFKREFRLAEHVVIDGADLTYGILRIKLSVVIPEEKQPRRIAIEHKS